MTDFFGVSMTAIMFVLVALLGVALLSVVAVAVRNHVLFSIGLRNIPRRRAQSALIVLGLMLSTIIVAAAFAIGDTVRYSVTNETYARLGHVDELLQVQENRKNLEFTDEQIAPAGLVSRQIMDILFADLNGNDDIDGMLPGARLPVPVSNSRLKITEPQVVLVGLDERNISGFEDDIVTPDGRPLDLSQLKQFDTLVNESTAKALDIFVGDRLDVWVGRKPVTFTVTGVVKDTMLTGWTQGQANGMVVRLNSAQGLFGFKTSAGFIALSNKGGVRDSVGGTQRTIDAVHNSLGESRFEVNAVKRDRVQRAEELGANMTAIFVVLGLFSIAAGLLLVFLILVTLAAERRPEMGMARAVGMKRLQMIEAFMAEGMAYSVTSAAAGAGLGVLVALGMARAIQYIFHSFDVTIAFHVTPRSLVIAYCLGVVLTFITVVVSAWRISNMSIVAAIREVNEPPRRATGRSSSVAGSVLGAAGLGFVIWGLTAGQAWGFGAGLSLIAIGCAFAARSLGWRERPVFTATSIAVLVLWGLIAGGTLEPITGTLSSGIETFFVSGVLMVAAATFVVIFNAELLLGSVRAVGVVFSRALPAVRTAVAYPLANKFRTGMTIAMMSLVVFALVMISTMNMNFRRLFLSDDSRGGWDIEVNELATNTFTDANGNKLGPLGEALDRAFYDTRPIESISQVAVANPRATEITEFVGERKQGSPHSFNVLGADPVFLQENKIGLQARAKGFASDRDVWDAVRADPNNAVIDGSVVPGINYANVTASRFTLENYESGTTSFDPFPLLIRDTSSDKTKPVRVIGIMNRGPSETYAGLFLSQDAFNKALPALYKRYYVRMKPGVDAEAEAKKMEQALAKDGTQAHSIKAEVEKEQRLNSAFFYLLQGFMALGLGVGIASLGVIAFRTVVERRQQIGLMRAIGFSRASIALTFVLESAFVAVLGIVNGIWLALLLANRLLASDQFKTAGFTTFYVPWLQIALMAGAVFVASVLTTIIPSRQASSIPIADALRYE